MHEAPAGTDPEVEQGLVRIVVPLYNPEPQAIENLRLMARQAQVVAVDDGSSSDASDVIDAVARLRGVTLIRIPENQGIAAALNRGIEAATRDGADVVVTFDQDSKPAPSHVEQVVALAGTVNGPVVVGPGVVGGEPLCDEVGAKIPKPYVVVSSLYQSGMAVPIRTVATVGHFDESLFIDGVDTEYCLRVTTTGGRVLAIPDLHLEHRLGAGHENFRRVRVGWFTPVATFHSPDRRYYINRNLVRLVRRYGRNQPRWAAVAVRRTMGSNLLACTVEDRRREKLRAVLVGLCDGLRGRAGVRSSRNDGGQVAGW
jgi:rhamnosyltransferase